MLMALLRISHHFHFSLIFFTTTILQIQKYVVAIKSQPQSGLNSGIGDQQPVTGGNLFGDPFLIFTPTNEQGFSQSVQQQNSLQSENPSNQQQLNQPSSNPFHQGFDDQVQQQNPFNQQHYQSSYDPFNRGHNSHLSQGYGNFGWGQNSNNQQQFGFSKEGQQMNQNSFSNSPFNLSPQQTSFQRNPMSSMLVMMMIMKSNKDKEDKSFLKLLMMMMSFGLINPTMFMMLAQNEKDSFDDNLKDYLVDQMSNGKKQFSSFDFYNQQKPMEYNFFKQVPVFGSANNDYTRFSQYQNFFNSG